MDHQRADWSVHQMAYMRVDGTVDWTVHQKVGLMALQTVDLMAVQLAVRWVQR